MKIRSTVFFLAALVGASAAAWAGNYAGGPIPVLPDPHLTPGAIITSDPNVVCHPGYSRTVRHTSGRLKHEIYLEYGMEGAPGTFEIDHLVPLSIGGADVAANLWPQSHDTQPWNADVKDRLEWKLLHLVCSGEVPMAEAQADIARNWIEAYQKYCPTEGSCPSYAESHGGRR